jgi:Mg-chelatase subunit ChlD
MNPRSSRHLDYRPGAGCEAVTFEFDGNGQAYGWSVLTTTGSTLTERVTAGGDEYRTTVLAGDLDRVVGVVTALSATGTVDVRSGCTVPTITVERPTTAAFAVVGAAADPRRLIARVDVNGPSGEPVRGLSADAFDVALRAQDGATLPAQVLSSVDVQGDHWLLLDLPDAAAGAADGTFYDLVVTLGSASGAQNRSILYADAGERDVTVVIDRSGSMGGTTGRIEAARNAGILLVEELADRDQGGFVAFSTDAEVRRALERLDVGTQRDDLQTAIRDTLPIGQTSIGDGMRAAATDHDANRDADNACAFVLLSDGAENEDARWGDVRAEVADNGCALHVIGLGGSTDEPLLQQIAAAVPGGSYDYADAEDLSGAPDAEFSTTSWENRLGALYDEQAAGIANRERLVGQGFEADGRTARGGQCGAASRTVNFDDAAPETIREGEQLTADGVTFTGRAFDEPDGPESGTARVVAPDLELASLVVEAAVPACQAPSSCARTAAAT